MKDTAIQPKGKHLVLGREGQKALLARAVRSKEAVR